MKTRAVAHPKISPAIRIKEVDPVERLRIARLGLVPQIRPPGGEFPGLLVKTAKFTRRGPDPEIAIPVFADGTDGAKDRFYPTGRLRGPVIGKFSRLPVESV